MQMIQQHVGNMTQKESKIKTVDLDEKIRRIREENKARDKRFKEIEADKIQALGNGLPQGLPHGLKDVGCFEVERSSENEQGIKEMKGVFVTSERKIAKGRGQRLLEMSKEPLKAKDFESKARESLKSLQEKPSKERLKAKDFESMARESLKTQNEKNNEEPALKAKDFEAKAREFLKTVEGKTHLNEIKLLSEADLPTETRNKPNKVKYFTNQGRSKEKNDLPLCSDIPESRYINPLMDTRYLDKPNKGNNAGFQSCTEKDADVKGKGINSIHEEKGGGSYQDGQKLDHTRHKDSGTISGESVREEKSLEDWGMEVMNLDESKVEPISDIKLGVTDLPCKELKTDSHEEETDISLLSEGAEIKDNTRFTEWRKPQLHDILEVCQTSAEQLPMVFQNNEDDVKKEKVSPNKETKEELEMSTDVVAPVLQNNTSKEQAVASKDTINETKPKGKNSRPKVDTAKIKKTLSNSSFEYGMSLLSPLDVPTNWGDLVFNDDNATGASGGVFYPTMGKK